MLSSNVLQIPASHRVGLHVRNLSVTAGTHRILDDVSFDLPESNLLAIMGGSGSGKTTLLNTLSQRTNINTKSLSFDGSVTYTNSTVSHAYLLQTDVFLAGLTLYETLDIQSDLRMPSNVPKIEKLALVESLLDILQLTHLRDTRILDFSSSAVSTLSGGEQRRVSLAIQLLCRPSLLFLDEPTTGLDTTSSLKLVESLKKLCSPEFGLTIILSIHQPRPEIACLFDKICFLTRGGRVVYYGGLSDAASYFSKVMKQNFCPEKVLEEIMDISVKDSSSKQLESETAAKISTLVEQWKSANSFESSLSKEECAALFRSNLILFKRKRIPLWKEVAVTAKRTFMLTYRDFSAIAALTGGCTLLAIAVGLIFYKPKPDLAGIRSITSVLYAMLEVIGFSPMIFELERLWSRDGTYFQREYSEKVVSVPGFIISRRLGKLLLEDLPVPVAFAAVTYFMCGLRLHDSDGNYDASFFAIYMVLTILTHLTGVGAAIFVFAVSPDFNISSLLMNLVYQLQNSACGYFVNAKSMPVYVRWTKYIAYFWYAFGALNANQFTDWVGNCPYDESSAACVEYTGNYQLSVLGFPQGWIGSPIGILVGWFIGLHIFAGIALYLKPYDISMSKQKKNRIGGEEDDEIDSDNKVKIEDEETRTVLESSIDVSIANTNIWVSTGFGKKNQKQLLHDVSANFLANKLNAIMGPSGSGKTTLLNYLSNRSKVSSTGNIELNGTQEVSRRDLSKISAYVTQHDNSLIPKLTVRETLYYQAHLRLPVEQHPDIPRIVAAMIRSTSLSDCADTLIGDEYVKGISGGEKRRVSIAIQLLSKPKVLFLDEPTSGLDSTTAGKILVLLAELASSNSTTVIMTIHQPHQEMFYEFGSVLLLARGGHVVFNGATREVSNYFESVGYPAPSEMNIADHIMDVLSTSEEESEDETQKRVAELIDFWSVRKQNILLSTAKKLPIDLSMYFFRRAPFTVTVPVVVKREFLNIMRSKDVIISRAGQTIFLGIINALYFAPLRNNSAGINNRLGLTQEALNLYFVGIVNNISIYPIERDLFYQEYKDGIYGVAEFSFSYLLNELPTEIVPSLFFSAMIVFVCGLPRTAGMYFSMFLTSLVSINCGESLGIFVNSIFDNLGVSTNILANGIILAIFMGGTMSLHMPAFFRGINWISPMKYAVGLCTNLGFRGQDFDCGLKDCVLSTGEEVLSYYRFDEVSVAANIWGLVACLVLYRIIAIAAVYIKVKLR